MISGDPSCLPTHTFTCTFNELLGAYAVSKHFSLGFKNILMSEVGTLRN